TYRLAEIAENLICVERDPKLARYIKEKFGGEKVRVITGDILKQNKFFDSNAWPNAGGDAGPKTANATPFNIISNLPYGISTDIIYFLAALHAWNNCVLTLQKETAERFSAAEGSSAYGRTSVTASVFFNIKMAFSFSKKCFSPSPKVDAGVLVLQNKKLNIDISEWKNFINGCFFSRRKTLANNLKRFTGVEKVNALLESSGINPRLRPQELSPEKYFELFKKL
ncbi:MAG: hypothetical protein J7M11_06675, partial [Elusimicrobia bacterium]|nr:hypothetical protein [Elusimicrobiota bacterium]